MKLLDLDTENKARGSLTHFFGGRVPFAAEEVRRLGRAARLTLAPGEEAALARHLDRILEAFGTLLASTRSRLPKRRQ